MNKKRNIYRGVKRKRNKNINIVLPIILGGVILGGYGIYKISDTDILKDINIFPNKKETAESYSYDDVKEVIKSDDKNTNNSNTDNTEKNTDVNIATINPYKVYTIQVGALTDESKINSTQAKLLEEKIPFAIIEVDGVSKIQTYAYSDETSARENLDTIKSYFPDAFLSKIEIPVMSFEYTQKYDYIKEISDEINKLIINFEEESNFWKKNKQTVMFSEYDKIIEDRNSIIENLSKSIEKIDYEALNLFKENLNIYIKSLKSNIDVSKKASKDNDEIVCQSLLISSIQGYFNFINSLQK